MKITLRQATKLDIPIIHKWWTNGEVMASVGFPNGIETSYEEILKAVQSYKKNDAEFLLILDEKNQPIGEFCYFREKETQFTFDIKIGEVKKQCKGYGKSALLLGIERIKSKQIVSKIIIYVDPKNTRAMRLYESIGFKIKEVRQDNWINQVGEKCSTAILALVLS